MEPTVVNMEVYLSEDRVRPIILCKSDRKLILPPGEYDIRFFWEGNEEWLEGVTIVNGQVLVKKLSIKASCFVIEFPSVLLCINTVGICSISLIQFADVHMISIMTLLVLAAPLLMIRTA